MRQGTEAEDRAATYLLTLGYTLLTRRFKGRDGEIDIICLDGETVVFVEVKTRSGKWESPEEAVTVAKLGHLSACAHEYLGKFEIVDRPARFDVIAFDPDGMRHILDAFHL